MQASANRKNGVKSCCSRLSRQCVCGHSQGGGRVHAFRLLPCSAPGDGQDNRLPHRADSGLPTVRAYPQTSEKTAFVIPPLLFGHIIVSCAVCHSPGVRDCKSANAFFQLHLRSLRWRSTWRRETPWGGRLQSTRSAAWGAWLHACHASSAVVGDVSTGNTRLVCPKQEPRHHSYHW